jgi:hypothetical protein
MYYACSKLSVRTVNAKNLITEFNMRGFWAFILVKFLMFV